MPKEVPTPTTVREKKKTVEKAKELAANNNDPTLYKIKSYNYKDGIFY